MNKQGNSRALFLKLFAGEVLTTFKSNNIALGLTRVRTISNGKSASFPMIGKNRASYHTPGKLIEGNKIGHAERTVTIDDVAVAPVFIADIDEAMTHYSYRGQYSEENGGALAELVDKNIFRMIAKSAFITDKTKAEAEGLMALEDEDFTQNVTVKTKADGSVDGGELVSAIFKARTVMRKANIRQTPVCVLPPEHYESLVNIQDTNKVTWMNKDVGGAGSMADGSIARVAGIAVLESNHVPQQDESAGLVDTPEPIGDETIGSGNERKYLGDFSKVIGLIFTPDAVATVKLMDIQTREVDEPLRLGTTLLSKLCVGHNILRPACAIALLKGSTTAVKKAGGSA
ncbi:hypothetical protein [Salinivibrio kushneri]|uniref:hypothetical protein n=2 Tax=Salinivibrio TaxID=51366 RepID=UPI0018E3E4DA|nr:hypothetical protein [Salinivibrio kushneri]